MKLKTLLVAVTTFGLWAFALNLHAQVTQTITLTLLVTHPNTYNDNGSNTIATSKTEAHTTVELLKILAEDEYAAGNLVSSNLPVGAKLVVTTNGAFQIWSKTNSLLVDVTNILSFTMPTANIVESGRWNDTNRLGGPLISSVFIGTLIFDDTAIVGGQNLQFFLQGVVRQTQIDSINLRNGTYTETRTGILTGAGDGTSNGGGFVLTGTAVATGRGTQPLPPIIIISGLPK